MLQISLIFPSLRWNPQVPSWLLETWESFIFGALQAPLDNLVYSVSLCFLKVGIFFMEKSV